MRQKMFQKLKLEDIHNLGLQLCYYELSAINGSLNREYQYSKVQKASIHAHHLLPLVSRTKCGHTCSLILKTLHTVSIFWFQGCSMVKILLYSQVIATRITRLLGSWMFQTNYAALYITSQDKRMANFPMEGGKLSDFAANHVSFSHTHFQ